MKYFFMQKSQKLPVNHLKQLKNIMSPATAVESAEV